MAKPRDPEEAIRHAKVNGAKHNPAINCAFCGTQGEVWTRFQYVKGGVSKAKKSAALWTGGLSLAVTGIRKTVGSVTILTCGNCGMEHTVG